MPDADRPLYAVALREEAIRRVVESAGAAGVSVVAVPRCEDVGAALVDAHPLAIVLPLEASGAARAFAQIRCQVRFAQVPIFGAVAQLNDLAFTELFVWGGDDLVGLAAMPAMSRRLRVLRGLPIRAADAAPTAPRQALVAGADPTWRTVLGRSLLNGGFAVRFATSTDGLADECVNEQVRVVVAADDLPTRGPFEALSEIRARGSDAACIVVAPPKRMAAATAAVAKLGRASVADGFAPPENVLFLVNELLAARGIDKRASPRLLYGTAVAFRAAGRDEDEHGFSYNVSAGGLFVRTLSPLESGQDIWLEMWPPRTERRVRLAGVVAWRRHFGPNGGATVPAGFGVQLTDGLKGDLDRWRHGYDAFAATLMGKV